MSFIAKFLIFEIFRLLNYEVPPTKEIQQKIDHFITPYNKLTYGDAK